MDLRVVAVFWTLYSLLSSFQGFWVVFCVRGVWVSESVFSFWTMYSLLWIYRASWVGE